MTVAELLDRISSEEITEWLAFADLEPFGGTVEDMRAGLAPAVTVNVNRGEEGKVYGPLDFYPWHARREPEPEPVVEIPQGTLSEQGRIAQAIWLMGRTE